MSEETGWFELAQLDATLRPRQRLDPSKIAHFVLKTGLSPYEALHRYMRFGEVAEALAVFISSVCSQGRTKRILEYTSTAPLLTGPLADRGQEHQVVYVSPDRELAETLEVLFREKAVSVIRSVADVPAGVMFDAIVCQPPHGYRPAGDRDADGFGGEVVRKLLPLLAEGSTLYWVSARGIVFDHRAKSTLADLAGQGLHTTAVIDLAPGTFQETIIEGEVIALRRGAQSKRFVGALRDLETAKPMASAFLAGPSKKDGPSWTWLGHDDQRTFADLERARLYEKLTPRGRYAPTPLGSLLTGQRVQKADRPVEQGDRAAAFLFIPEYPGSRATADLEEQTVEPRAIHRLPVDSTKANPRFLARLLNSPLGKLLRASTAHGVTINRTSVPALLSLELPIPDLATQERLVRIDSDIGILQAAFREMQEALDRDWTALSDVTEKIDELKAVLDIEHRIADWWRELPYPLATIYRRYQISTEPKERLEIILHFFEMVAAYLATVGISHVKALRPDWEKVLPQWLHPAGAAGIERADFGFWISLAGASLKDTSRIASDKELRASATENAGPELVQVASVIGPLGKATKALDVARRYRNSWIGLGGHMKASDAARLDGELQQSVRDLYEIAAPVFRRFHLVRPGMADVTETGFKYQLEKLSGSDPTFEKEQVELARPAKTNALAFWMSGARTTCRALPFFRLGAPQQPQETNFYIFNRVENGGLRWICYQDAREQEFVAPDEELLGLIALRAGLK